MDPPSPGSELPPPAYEAPHEYDRKISDALERSLHISQAQPTEGEDDVWEEWDESKFEAAVSAAQAREQAGADGPPSSRPLSEKERLARQDASAERSSEGASSSTSAGRGRRLPSSPPIPGKERPSWLAEAQLDTPAAAGSSRSYHTSSNPPQIHHLPPEEEEPDEQLPAFAPVGPSLEGPPYVVREPRRLQLGSGADSPPQSPLDGGDDLDSAPERPPSFPPPSNHRPTYRQPSATPRQSAPPPMLRASPTPSSSPRPPPMRFDPAIAYTKPHGAFNDDTQPKPAIDASAFYNSAVSSFLPNQQARPPKKNNPSNRGSLATSSTYGSGAPNLYPQAQPAPIHSTPPAPVHNPYYSQQQQQAYIPNQYPQQQYQQQQQQQQQPPQVVPGMYGTYAQSAAPAPAPAAPAHWSPYTYGGQPGQ